MLRLELLQGFSTVDIGDRFFLSHSFVLVVRLYQNEYLASKALET